MKKLLLSTTLLLAACGSYASESDAFDAEIPSPVTKAEDSNRNPLDWSGTYTGTIPCADCEGIETTVTLRADGTFASERIYLGKSDKPVRSTGTFTRDSTGRVVRLESGSDSAQQYLVGEDRLFHLDGNGNRISGNISEHYILKKAIHDSRIEDKKWLLTELTGWEIDPAGNGHKAFIYLESDRSHVSGNAGCNRFFGTYMLPGSDRIRFSDGMGSTRMACPDMEAERRFMEALLQVDNFSLNDGALTLNDARTAPLMRFELEGNTD